jgi:hypothetical protein
MKDTNGDSRFAGVVMFAREYSLRANTVADIRRVRKPVAGS